MSATDSVAATVALRFNQEAVCQGDLAVVDELVAPDVVHHSAFPGQAPGLQGMKDSIVLLRDAVPDLNLEPDDVIADGDKVMVRFKISGTNAGSLFGMAPTGKTFEMDEYFVARVQDGKIVEIWSQQDRLSMLQQLGVVES